jgi:hypothetical protein
MLRDDLSRLIGLLEDGNEKSAEILSDALMEDLRKAGRVQPSGSDATARIYNELAIPLQTCRVNIHKGRLDNAAANVIATRNIFMNSPWYPTDREPAAPKVN